MAALNHCRGRKMTAGGAGKSQQCHKCILQYSKFASERSQVRTWGRQTCFLPRAPFNLITPLYGMRAFLFCHNVCPSCYVTIPQFGHKFNFFQAIFAPPQQSGGHGTCHACNALDTPLLGDCH